VVNCLKSLTISDAQRKEIERELRQRAKADPAKRERAALQRRLTKLEAEEIETARMEAQRRITPVVADRMRREQQRERSGVQSRLDALPQLVRPQDAAPVLLMRVNLAERIEADYQARNWTALRILVEAFITRVNVFEGQATRHQWRQRPRRIEVVWNQRSLT
jgi:HrpA-like RNA helicase